MGYFQTYAAPVRYSLQRTYSQPKLYSALEDRIAYMDVPSSNYAISLLPAAMPFFTYHNVSNTYKGKPYSANHETTTQIMHETFLNPLRPRTQFIDDASQIREHVEKAFKLTTGDELPRDFTIQVLDEKTFRKIKPEQGVLGFAINRKKFGRSSIVVMEQSLDMMMIVVGHEIGHVLTLPVLTEQDEEAKAFAFQFAWTKAIFENNIAGLSRSIDSEIFRPAQNGIHNIAFSFVQKLTSSGRKSLEVYGLIASGLIGVNNWNILDF